MKIETFYKLNQNWTTLQLGVTNVTDSLKSLLMDKELRRKGESVLMTWLPAATLKLRLTTLACRVAIQIGPEDVSYWGHQNITFLFRNSF